MNDSAVNQIALKVTLSGYLPDSIAAGHEARYRFGAIGLKPQKSRLAGEVFNQFAVWGLRLVQFHDLEI